MKTLRRFSLTKAVLFSFTSAMLLGDTSGRAADTLIARSQLRRTVDPSPRSSVGTVLMKIDGNGKETFQVNIRKLGEDNFSLFFYERPSYTTNLTPGLDLPPLDRTSFKKGNWPRTLAGTGQAPADFLPFFGHLTELANLEIE